MWGAQGGDGKYDARTRRGGYGGYSIGIFPASISNTLYIHVGGKGTSYNASASSASTDELNGKGYNGGRYGSWRNGSTVAPSSTMGLSAGQGGGATHISTIPGLLKNLEQYKGTLINGSYYVSDKVLIVAGGGGGGVQYGSYGNYVNYSGTGGDGGGISGNGGICSGTCYGVQTPGNQTGPTPSGDSEIESSFGLGGGFNVREDENNTDQNITGGGAGWYGGGAQVHAPAAGGSGYIGSSNLISGGGVTKHMTCYSCTTSSTSATRTYSNTNVSATATTDYSKTGNGYARIAYLGTSI